MRQAVLSRSRRKPSNAAATSTTIATSESAAAPIHLGLLESLYRVRRPSEVSGFLSVRPELVELLMEAALNISERFDHPPVSLELDVDPESGWEQVTAEIRTSLPLESAFEQLRALDEAWWLDNSPRAAGRLCITLGFE